MLLIGWERKTYGRLCCSEACAATTPGAMACMSQAWAELPFVRAARFGADAGRKQTSSCS